MEECARAVCFQNFAIEGSRGIEKNRHRISGSFLDLI